MDSRPDSSQRRRPRSRRGLSGDSPLLGGRLDVGAGFEEPRPRPAEYDARSGVLDLPPRKPDEGEQPDPRELQELIPSGEPGRALDDWGRSQRVFDLMEPLLDFYYRYWFRVEARGVENVPGEGGALLVSNHSGALPPDAATIAKAIREEHPRPRQLYITVEHFFKGYPGFSMLIPKIGCVAAHPANVHRLLYDERQIVLVFPEGRKGTEKLYKDR